MHLDWEGGGGGRGCSEGDKRPGKGWAVAAIAERRIGFRKGQGGAFRARQLVEVMDGCGWVGQRMANQPLSVTVVTNSGHRFIAGDLLARHHLGQAPHAPSFPSSEFNEKLEAVDSLSTSSEVTPGLGGNMAGPVGLFGLKCSAPLKPWPEEGNDAKG